MNLPLFGQESHLRADDIIAFCLYVKFRKQRSPKSSDKISQVLVNPESSHHPKNNDPPKVAIFLKPRFPFCNIKRYAKLIQGLLFMIVMIFDIPIQGQYMALQQMMYNSFCFQKVFCSLLTTRCIRNRDDVFKPFHLVKTTRTRFSYLKVAIGEGC